MNEEFLKKVKSVLTLYWSLFEGVKTDLKVKYSDEDISEDRVIRRALNILVSRGEATRGSFTLRDGAQSSPAWRCGQRVPRGAKPVEKDGKIAFVNT